MLAGLIAGCTDSSQKTQAVEYSPVDLETVAVQHESIDEEIVFDGTLEALNQSTVASETNARVIELPFDIDDYVEKGQVIVRFRDSEQKAQMSSAEAALSEAEARYTDTRLEFERAEKLYARGLIPKAEMDSATAAYESAQARVRAAEAGLNRAREQLEHTVVRAPYSGIVVKRHIEVGETATVGQPLMTGLSLEHLRAVVEIPQQHVGPLRKHRKARVIFPDGRWVEASELRIPPTADATTHTFRVLVSLPPADHGVYPGTLVKVAFVRGRVERLVVPTESVVRRGELTAVYVIDDDNRISFRYLRTGSPTGDGFTPVLAGVRRGERVATDGVAAAIAYKKQPGEETENEP
ncbi:MAG: efflux RND transporter periplasmic adaptor subunit [Pseudomonadales bacterium]|nr:efflux RND transporter periplasmic adaptor subunit [Pseudomonadales bacterium]